MIRNTPGKSNWMTHEEQIEEIRRTSLFLGRAGAFVGIALGIFILVITTAFCLSLHGAEPANIIGLAYSPTNATGKSACGFDSAGRCTSIWSSNYCSSVDITYVGPAGIYQAQWSNTPMIPPSHPDHNTTIGMEPMNIGLPITNTVTGTNHAAIAVPPCEAGYLRLVTVTNF